MKGIDYRTGHVYQLAANGSGEVHDDSCQHPEHGSQPFTTIAVPEDNATFDADTVRRMTDAEVQHHGAQQLRKDWNTLMSDFHGETEAKAIEDVAPNPEKENTDGK